MDEKFLIKINRIRKNIFETFQYEDFLFKDNKTDDNWHKLNCEIILDPILFLAYNKTVTIKIRIKNSDLSQTPWYKFNLNIEDKIIKEIYNKLQENIADENPEIWLNTWKENSERENESKFDFKDRK